MEDINRRSFIAVTAGAIAAPLGAFNLEPTTPFPSPDDTADQILEAVGQRAVSLLAQQLETSNFRVKRDYEPTLAMRGEVVNIPIGNGSNGKLGNSQVILWRHIEASFLRPDATSPVARRPELLDLYLRPVVLVLSERIEQDLLDLADCPANARKCVLVVRRPGASSPLSDISRWVISAYIDSQYIGARVSIGYDPHSLAQLFSIEILYGCGILRDGWKTDRSIKEYARLEDRLSTSG